MKTGMFPLRSLYFPGLLLIFFVAACSAPAEPEEAEVGMLVSHLDSGEPTGFTAIREAFKKRNEGYDLSYFHQVMAIEPGEGYRLAFLQSGGGTAVLGSDSSKVSVGDILYLQPQQSLAFDSLMSFLVFSLPDALPEEIPAFIRPDWDLNITDTPGGCATETNAYRRILLTWEGKNGPYLYHALNAHRVRIVNSFTHYHPLEGGFDEFYLVQMAQPKARLITSEKVERIIAPESVQQEEVPGLLQETPLKVGDLVYLPRGVVHRGIDGVLAQIITVPGFIPGSEIGVDHHLKAINDNLMLEGDMRLPYHEEAAQQVVIK